MRSISMNDTIVWVISSKEGSEVNQLRMRTITSPCCDTFTKTLSKR